MFATNWQGPESAKSATVTVNDRHDRADELDQPVLGHRRRLPDRDHDLLPRRGRGQPPADQRRRRRGLRAGQQQHRGARPAPRPAGRTRRRRSRPRPAARTSPAPFGWAAGTTSAPAEAVTGRDVAGNTAVTNLTFTNDSTAPTAGTITYADGYAVRPLGEHHASPPAPTPAPASRTRRLQRASATLTGGHVRDLRRLRRHSARSTRRRRTSTARSPIGLLQVPLRRHRPGRQPGRRHQRQRRQGRLRRRPSAPPPGCSATGASARAARSRRPRPTRSPAPPARCSPRTPASSARPGRTRPGTANATVSNEQPGLQGRHRLHRSTTRRSAPATADYSVEADLVVKSNLAGDVVGRASAGSTPRTNTFYLARWEAAGHQLERLARYTNGDGRLPRLRARPACAHRRADLPPQARDGRLIALKLYVNGVLKVSATDTTLTAPAGPASWTGRVGHQRRADQHHRACTSTTSRSRPTYAGARQQGHQPRRLRERRDPRCRRSPRRRLQHRRVVRRRQRLRPDDQHHRASRSARARGRSRRGSRRRARPAR